MELEEAIKVLVRIKKNQDRCAPNITVRNNACRNIQAIETVLNHLTKQDKMIGNIFSYLDDHRIDDNICDEILNYGAKDCIHNGHCIECIKQYFEKKADED